MIEINGLLSELLLKNPNTLEKLAIDIPFIFGLSLGSVYFGKLLVKVSNKLDYYFERKANTKVDSSQNYTCSEIIKTPKPF